MRIGTVREIKDGEHRVALTPDGVSMLAARHDVLVERGAGAQSGFSDDAYQQRGAQLIESADEIWASVDLLVKVKEPISMEYGLLRAQTTLFTFLHLASDRALTERLMASGCDAIAYELVRDINGRLPLCPRLRAT